jgi:hypothetical protein
MTILSRVSRPKSGVHASFAIGFGLEHASAAAPLKGGGR